MRKLSAQGQLDMDAVFQTMTKPKPNQQEKVTLPFVKLPIDKIRNYAKTEPTPQIVQDFLPFTVIWLSRTSVISAMSVRAPTSSLAALKARNSQTGQ